MNSRREKLKTYFFHLVLFVAGSCCGYLIKPYLDLPHNTDQDNVPFGYKVNSVVRPFDQNQDHPMQFDQTVLNDLKEKPCSECKAFKLRLPAKAQTKREEALKRYEKRQMNQARIHNQVDGSSPISYPAHGVYVRPMRSVWLEELRVEWLNLDDLQNNIELKFQINATKGILKLLGQVQGVDVIGNGSSVITISTHSPSLMNYQLKYIAYENTIFDASTIDLVQIQFLKFTATMPIHIQHVQLPWLFEEGTGQIKDRVTFVIKTFLRYSRLQKAIKSVNDFYPGTRIVVADDTPDHLFNSFQSSNVDHYRMPAYKGFFAGRNLGLSQVSTEYFFYMDDDMQITEKTNMELLVLFLDKTNFHIVGVTIQNVLIVTTIEAFGNTKDRCLTQKPDPGYYNEITGFPGIYANDGIQNIFLATTNEVKAVGFDPHRSLARTGHIEFFLSALGRLRVAACHPCSVRHSRGGLDPGNYTIYRQSDIGTRIKRNNYNLYKHNLYCLEQRWIKKQLNDL